MKFYTKKDTKLVFTVNKDSNVSDLIEVKREDVLKVLKSKGLAWVSQLNEACFSLILEEAIDLTDERIESFFNIAHDDELSEDCAEVFSL